MLALTAQAALAETVYRGTDSDGNVIFSDQPLPNGQRIEIQPAQTYSSPPLPKTNPSNNSTSKQVQETRYEINILEPQNNQTLTTDIQSVPVALSVVPNLQKGDKIRLLVNGKQYGALTDSLNITIDRLDRGSYQLKAEVVSEADPSKIKGESNSITFYQRRTSIN